MRVVDRVGEMLCLQADRAVGGVGLIRERGVARRQVAG